MLSPVVMAELVDALVSEASEETHGSSSLLGHTNFMNNRFEIYPTKKEELDEAMAIYDHARLFMRQNGNLEQWINGYPSKEIILEDIALNRSFVIKKDNNIEAVFTFINGNDETYNYIEGKWLNDEPYGVIHRIASKHQEKGMLKAAVDYGFRFVRNMRIDTHKDNIVMQKALEKEGFIKCGIIYLKDGNPRIAYQKIRKIDRYSTCCYLKKDEQYLLLYRNKKKDDYNKGKWIGVGGGLEKDETPNQCAIREIKEETGLNVHSLNCAGEVDFIYDGYFEKMYIYEITNFDGTIVDCNEGELRWIPIKDIYNYPMWEGDKAFLPLLINHEPYFKMVLTYSHDKLISVKKL